MFHHKDKNLYKINIKYSEIKWIFRRRYYYKDSALEIFTINNKSYYFNFKYENDRETVLENIIKKLKDYNKVIMDLKDTKDNFDNVIGYRHNLNAIDVKKSFFKRKDVFLSKKVEDWKKWKISNFEFLMWLNIYSNRSYNDISQYPVFPWTLIDFDDPLKKEIDINQNVNTNKKNLEQIEKTDYFYRDLSSPIGMLGIGEKGEQRKENYILSFEELKNAADEFEGQKPFFYGSNYSNPIYICNYLVRVFPFTSISIELQGKQMDDSNRLFFSIKNTFITCSTLKTDIRELVPEFFYLPEMLLNLNDINLGKREDGIVVDDVITPCNNDPYKFVETMKIILESNKISYNLQNWIDLIFGYKARGKEAELAKNIFSEASYQENIDLNKVEDKQTYLRMVEFGVIPNQIMTKECPKREKKEEIRKGKEITDINAQLKIYKMKNNKEENNDKHISEKKYKNKLITIKSRLFNNEKLMLFNGNKTIEKKVSYSIFDKSFSEETVNILPPIFIRNRMRYYFMNNQRQNKCTIFCNQGKTMILGGFYDGSVKFINISKNICKAIIPFRGNEPILALALDKEEKYLFVGNTIGNVKIYEINVETYENVILKYIMDHLSEISHIDINNELNLWLSASIDGFVNIYTMPDFKSVRSIKTLAKKLEYAFLSTSSLPSIIVIGFENEHGAVYSYSINGKYLTQKKEEDTLLNPIIIKDLNCTEYLIYISKNNNSIVIRDLPFLNIHTIINDMVKINSICVSDDIKLLYAISYENDEIYVVKDDANK
jgi:WD40 repeat protein